MNVEMPLDVCTATNYNKINPRLQEYMGNIFMTAHCEDTLTVERYIIDGNRCETLIIDSSVKVLHNHGMCLLGSQSIFVFGGKESE